MAGTPVTESAMIGWGGSLECDDVGGVSTPFTFCKECNTPKNEQEFVDSSYINQPDRFRRFVPSLIMPGEVAFILHYTSTDLARCYALRGQTNNYIVKFPDGASAAFSGLLMNAEAKIGVDQIIEINASVKVTGPTVFTEAVP